MQLEYLVQVLLKQLLVVIDQSNRKSLVDRIEDEEVLPGTKRIGNRIDKFLDQVQYFVG